MTDSRPVLRLPQGCYRGRLEPRSAVRPRAVEAFLGIPYAQSTAAHNRFRPPQALPAPSPSASSAPGAPADASQWGPVCPQLAPGPGQGEDCLNLNVFRPGPDDRDNSSGQEPLPLPLLVYVHGGGFNNGAGKERDLASFVAWAESPLLALSFNYRVGALGFLPCARAARDGLLNLGLRDQHALLDWVRRNAHHLGADPDNVTLVGMSAGAHSIGHHLMAYAPANNPPTPAPFHKAILESGGPTARAVFTPDHPLHERQFAEFLTECSLPDSQGINDNDTLWETLRALPLDRITTASRAVCARWSAPGPPRWPFQPAIDGPGGAVPDAPLSAWARSHAGGEDAVLRLPLITGFNTNEGAVFVPRPERLLAQAHTSEAAPNNNGSPSNALRNFMGALVPGLGAADLAALEDLYPDPDATTEGRALYRDRKHRLFSHNSSTSRKGDDDALASAIGHFWRLEEAYAHYAYICPVLQTAHLMSSPSSSSSTSTTLQKPPPPVYAYHYAAHSAARGAADHADEAPVVSHSPAATKTPGMRAVADVMAALWARFAASRAGDPNEPPDGPLLPATSPATPSRPCPRRGSPVVPVPAAIAGGFVWPRFASPFPFPSLPAGTAASSPPPPPSSPSSLSLCVPIPSTPASTPAPQHPHGQAGQLALFGHGNDERVVSRHSRRAEELKGGNPGVAAQTTRLTARQVRQCAYWWARGALSQARGDGALSSESPSTRPRVGPKL